MPSPLGHIQNLGQNNQTVAQLAPVNLKTPPYDEAWLQNLIHAHPSLIPASEIEACCDTLIPVLTEFTLPNGYRQNSLDNFYITPDGFPVLTEVKLWKNQEARREVVVQIIEYAKSFSELGYEDINKEIRRKYKTRNWGQNPLYEIVSAYVPDAPDETLFVDRVAKNIREGRFLLLIVGDGIQEEMASLAQYLVHHSLRYAFGVIQIKLHHLPDGSVIAAPNVLAKTQRIERHVTLFSAQTVGVPTTAPTESIATERVEKASLSTDDFYEKLGATSKDAVVIVKTVLEKLSDIPVELSVGADYAALIAPLSDGESVILMKIDIRGGVEFWGYPNKKKKNPEWAALSRQYLEQVAALATGGAFVKMFESGHMDVYAEQTKKRLPLTAFAGKEDALGISTRNAIAGADAFFAKNPS